MIQFNLDCNHDHVATTFMLVSTLLHYYQTNYSCYEYFWKSTNQSKHKRGKKIKTLFWCSMCQWCSLGFVLLILWCKQTHGSFKNSMIPYVAEVYDNMLWRIPFSWRNFQREKFETERVSFEISAYHLWPYGLGSESCGSRLYCKSNLQWCTMIQILSQLI